MTNGLQQEHLESLADITSASLPAWASTPLTSDGARLTFETLRRVRDLIFNQPRREPTLIVPPPVWGTNQKARRRRTVWRNGVRVTLPEGSNPVLFIITDGRGGWGKGPRPSNVHESRHVQGGYVTMAPGVTPVLEPLD